MSFVGIFLSGISRVMFFKVLFLSIISGIVRSVFFVENVKIKFIELELGRRVFWEFNIFLGDSYVY